MKKCTDCLIEKELTEFPLRKRNKNGLYSKCKECDKKDRRKYYKENKDYIDKKNRKYQVENKEKIDIQKKKYCKDNKEELSKKRRKHYKDNKDIYAKQKRISYIKNRDTIIKKAKIYRDSERGKEVEKLSRDKKNKSRNIFNATPIGKLRAFCRESLRRIIDAIKQDKDVKTLDSLSYTLEELKEHIESLFTDGMSWNADIHIDHKIPLSKLVEIHKDKSQEEILNIVNALDNLQPLWAIDNLKKGNK